MINSVNVIGLGYIGLPTAVEFALAGVDVLGVDINAGLVEDLCRGKIHFFEPGLGEAFDEAVKSGKLRFSTEPEEADAFIISVQTPHKEQGDIKVSELRHVVSASKSVAKAVKKGSLVILESTVPPGSTRLMEQTVAEASGLSPEDFYCAHCPERIIPGNMLHELRNNDRIIGSRDPRAAELARELYARVVTGGTIRVTDDYTAEMCKLVENTFRDINIAYANELSLVCDRLGIDVFRLIELANCHPRVNVHTPGVGVGGHCIAVDPWFVHEKFQDITPLILNARRINDSKPHWVADKIATMISAPACIAVLGMSYKAGCDDLRESPSLELCHILRERGYEVIGCEPNIAESVVDGFENLSLDEALSRCAFAVVTLPDKVFKDNADKIRTVAHYDCVGAV